MRAITSFEQAIHQHKRGQTDLDQEKVESLGIDYDGIVINLRDSMIQRFEYSTDLLWKYLKSYFDVMQRISDSVAP